MPLGIRYIRHPLATGLPIVLVPWSRSDEPIDTLDRHDTLEVGLCLSGSGTYVIEGKTMPYQTGSVAIVNQVERHHSMSAPGTESQWALLFLRPERMIAGMGPDLGVLSARSFCGPDFRNVLPPDEHPETVGLVKTLVQELARPAPGTGAAVRGLVWAMMARLQRLPGKAPETGPWNALLRIGPALEHIEKHHVDELVVSDLAAACGMPERTFCRQFAEAMGEPPLRFLNRYRIERACERLGSSDASVLEIALAVGFGSLAAFNRQFRAVTGRTPGEWRRGLAPAR
jgi:AraC family transcriptional activator of mtrCDE